MWVSCGFSNFLPTHKDIHNMSKYLCIPDHHNQMWFFPKGTQLYRMSSYGTFPLLEPRGPNMFQHDNTAVHKASSMKTWVAWKFGVEESWLQPHWTLLGWTGHRLHPRHRCLTSLKLLWLKEEIPTATLTNLVERVPRRVEVILTANWVVWSGVLRPLAIQCSYRWICSFKITTRNSYLTPQVPSGSISTLSR